MVSVTELTYVKASTNSTDSEANKDSNLSPFTTFSCNLLTDNSKPLAGSLQMHNSYHFRRMKLEVFLRTHKLLLPKREC